MNTDEPTLPLPPLPTAGTGAGAEGDVFQERGAPRHAITGRILVVDDEPAIRAFLDKALTRMGHTVECAEDGRTALAMLRPDIDLVMLDIRMPGIDGFETARRMRLHSTAGDVPIIIVTAQDGREERLRAVEAGANDFIGKPVDLTELRVRTASLLHLKEAQDTARRYRAELEALVAARTAALVQARDEALAASRAKSALLGRMSHEFRTPLNHILGLSEALLEEMDGDGPCGQFAGDVRDIYDAGLRLLGIATDVLEFAEAQAGRTSLDIGVVNVPDILRDVEAAVADLAAKNGNRLDFNATADVGGVRTDRQKLARVLAPVVQNACKFTRGGTVRVRAARQDGPGLEWLVFTVSDTGIGMSPEQSQAACDAFWQAEEDANRRRFEGAGLGLTLARQFCELLGGDLTIRSQPGKGTEVVVRVPTALPVLAPSVAAGDKRTDL